MFNNVVKCKILIFFIKVYFDEVFYKEYFIVGEDIDRLCGEFLIFR